MGKFKIEVGEMAPTFKLESYNAGTIDLQQELGKSKIVLIFSRYFGCPICQLDLKLLLENTEKIASKGARLLYITQSGPETAKEIISAKKIVFPVIPSTKEGLYADYDLGKMTLSTMAAVPFKLKAANDAGIKHGPKEGSESQCPGQFVLDLTGKIIHVKKGWIDIESFLAVL
jgi:peroxiredoxin